MVLGFSIGVLIFCTTALAMSIFAAVMVTRDHLYLARKDRAEILASKATAVNPNASCWLGCQCFVCHIFDKIAIREMRNH